MKNRHVLLNILKYASLSLFITVSAHLANVWLLSSSEHLRDRFSPTDALFIEGVLLAGFGFLLLLGKGGISISHLAAALLSSKAEALGQDAPGPHETFRRDRWRPNGFIRAGLILMLAGVFMILVYFATL